MDGTALRFCIGDIETDLHAQKVYISSTGKQHEYYARLHEKYGDIVRTGEIFPSSVRVVLSFMFF